MSFRAWLLTKLIGNPPALVHAPTPDETRDLIARVMAWQSMGRHAANLSCEEALALLTAYLGHVERIEAAGAALDAMRSKNVEVRDESGKLLTNVLPASFDMNYGACLGSWEEVELRFPLDTRAAETRAKIRRREPVPIDDAYEAMGLPRPDEVFAAIQGAKGPPAFRVGDRVLVSIDDRPKGYHFVRASGIVLAWTSSDGVKVRVQNQWDLWCDPGSLELASMSYGPRILSVAIDGTTVATHLVHESSVPGAEACVELRSGGCMTLIASLKSKDLI